MLLDVLGCFLIILDSGGIFLLETALKPARFALILLVDRCKLVTVFHLGDKRVDKLSKLFGGAEGQALLDAVTAEHTLIGKLTDSGMSYADIEGLVDSSDSADRKSSNSSDSDVADGQTSFFEKENPYTV